MHARTDMFFVTMERYMPYSRNYGNVQITYIFMMRYDCDNFLIIITFITFTTVECCIVLVDCCKKLDSFSVVTTSKRIFKRNLFLD